MFALLSVARTGTKHTLISTSWRSSISSISRSLLRSWALESSSSFLLISQNALILSYNSMPGLSSPRLGNSSGYSINQHELHMFIDAASGQ